MLNALLLVLPALAGVEAAGGDHYAQYHNKEGLSPVKRSPNPAGGDHYAQYRSKGEHIAVRANYEEGKRYYYPGDVIGYDERGLPITATTTIVVPMTTTQTIWVDPTGVPSSDPTSAPLPSITGNDTVIPSPSPEANATSVLPTSSPSGNETLPSATPSANATSLLPSALPSGNATEPSPSANATSLLPSALPSGNETEPSASANATSALPTALPSGNGTEPSMSANVTSALPTALPSGNETEPSASSNVTSAVPTASPSGNGTEPSMSADITSALPSALPSGNSTEPSAESSPSANATTSALPSALPSGNEAEPSSSSNVPSGTTLSDLISATPSASASDDVTGEPSASASVSATVSASVSASASASASSASAPGATESASSSASGDASASPSATPSASDDASASSSAAASETPSASPSPSESASPSDDSDVASSTSESPSPSPSPSASASDVPEPASSSASSSVWVSVSSRDTDWISPTESDSASPSKTNSVGAQPSNGWWQPETTSTTVWWTPGPGDGAWSPSSTATASASEVPSVAPSSIPDTPPTVSSPSVPKPTGDAGERIMGGYWADWTSTKLPPESVDWSKFDVVNYAFAEPDASGVLQFSQSNGGDLITRLTNSAHTHGKRVVLSIGGWTGSAHFSTIMSTAAGRSNFVKNCVAAYEKYNLDGIDLDWEYPGAPGASGNSVSASDSANYLIFLKELRQAMPSPALITAATQVWPFYGSNGQPMTDVSEYADIFDWILIMNYDIYGSQTEPGPNGPLNDGCKTSSQPTANAYAAVAAWTAAGMPAHKISLGVAAYGYIQISDADRLQRRSYPVSRRAVTITNDEGGTSSGQINFASIVNQGALVRQGSEFTGAGGFVRNWDECSSTPWLKSEASGQIITYDDTQSMNLKGQFAAQAGLKGCSVWAMDGEVDGFPLVSAVRSGMGI